jgi:hypothetical protein
MIAVRASAASRRRARLTAAVGAASLVLVTACGSTAATQGAARADDDGLTGARSTYAAGPGGSGLGEPGALPGQASVAAGPAGITSTPDAGGGAPVTHGGSRGAGPSAAAAGPLPTGPVEIGIAYKEGLEQAGQAAGVKISTADSKAVFDALVDEVNRTGGLAGRQIRPVYVVTPSNSSQTLAQLDQEKCVAWTEDHHVAAVATGGGFTEVLPACLQKKGVPFLFVTNGVTEKRAFERYPLMHLLYPGQYRATGPWVEQLWVHGWFNAPGIKIGVMRYDLPDQTRIQKQILEPALKQHGLSVTAEAAINLNAGDGGVSAVQSALLSFRSKGVTHLVNVDPDGNLTLFGMKFAESNNYRPKWALTSYVLPYLQQINNQSQLAGAAGLGWAPTIDVDESRDPGSTPSRARCLKVMKDHGIQTADRMSVFQVTYSCDLLFVLQSVAKRAGSLTPAALQRGFDGTRAIDSAAFAGVGFSPVQHDAANRARYFVFDNACVCFRYDSKVFPF